MISGVFVSTLPSLSILRVLRLARLVRVMRILMAVKELQMLLHSFLSTLRTVFWASFMLLVLLSLWSIIAVEMVHPVNLRVAASGEYADCERCERAFSSVMQANLTFMQTIIAGDAWGVLAVPIIEEAPWTSLILVTSFISINLGILNLVLTAIVNAAQDAREHDEKLRAREHAVAYERQKKRLLKILSTLDEDKNGLLSMDEMQKAVQTNREFRTVLEAIDIRKDDVEEFFSFLASDSDTGEVTYRDFVDQVFKMKSGDTVALIRSLKNSLSKILIQVRSSRELLEQRSDCIYADCEGGVSQRAQGLGQEPEPVICKRQSSESSPHSTQAGSASAKTCSDEQWSTSIQRSVPSIMQRIEAVPEGPAFEAVDIGQEECLKGKWTVLPTSGNLGSLVVVDAMQTMRLELDRLHQRLHLDLMGVLREAAGRLKEDLVANGQDTSYLDCLVDGGTSEPAWSTRKQVPISSHQSEAVVVPSRGVRYHSTEVGANARPWVADT